MTEYERPYDPTWRDSGETAEPCPVPFCGANLYWGNFYSATHHKTMRHLLCRRSGCKYRSRKIDVGGVRGRTEREWLKTRER